MFTSAASRPSEREVLHMKMSQSSSAVSRLYRDLDVPIVAAALLLAIAAGCAGNAASSTVSESDFARLTATQTQPVDEARRQLALARDELGRAKLSAVNDQHEGELARSDQAYGFGRPEPRSRRDQDRKGQQRAGADAAGARRRQDCTAGQGDG